MSNPKLSGVRTPSPEDPRKSQEYDANKLRIVFDRINEGIEPPPSLRAEYMRGKLDGIEQERSDIISAVSFLRSRVLSLQSVVSYALAFVVIVAVAYAVNRQTPDHIIDGVVPIASENEVMEVVSRVADPTAQEESIDASSASGAAAAAENNGQSTEAVKQDPPADSEPLGVGGGGQAVPLTEDGNLSYLYRYNESFETPLTLEVICLDDNTLLAQISLEGMDAIGEFIVTDTGFVIIGESAGSFLAKGFSSQYKDGVFSAQEICTVEYGGAPVDARVVNGYLRIVTVGTDDPESGIEKHRLPDSEGDAACILVTVDMETGEANYTAFIGGDSGNRISVQNHSIYISYTVQNDDDKTELYMVQLKLEGIEPEMILVP